MLGRASSMRPKARGLTQHGGTPGWLDESDPGVILYVMDGPYRLSFPYHTDSTDRIACSSHTKRQVAKAE
jgi:hypothetical protein